MFQQLDEPAAPITRVHGSKDTVIYFIPINKIKNEHFGIHGVAIKFCGNWNIPFPSHGLLASSPWRIENLRALLLFYITSCHHHHYHLAGLNNTAARKLGCYARERTGMVQCTPALKMNPYNNQENNSLLTWVFRKSWRLCWHFNLTCRRTVISFFEMLQALCSQATVSVQIKRVTDILWSLFWVLWWMGQVLNAAS